MSEEDRFPELSGERRSVERLWGERLRRLSENEDVPDDVLETFTALVRDFLEHRRYHEECEEKWGLRCWVERHPFKALGAMAFVSIALWSTGSLGGEFLHQLLAHLLGAS